jgi:type II secretory ATPase GspE/PulE/Tfp pilus assembly ATPase PilB-like protein
MRELLQSFRPRPPAPARVTETGADATRTFDAILRAAATEGASDIHCEPKEDGLLIRFRIDGEMRDHARVPLAHRDALLARGKIFGGLDITEKRLPQDGRAVLKEINRRFNLRLSTVPTVYGESLVIRLLDQTMPGQSLAELGLGPPQAEAMRAALTGPAGLIYLTGPTGSGKTTTLHSALHQLDHRGRVIHTLEDPVEYEFPGIRQTEIREKIGLTFAASLRALLRQNPDVMLVGETRDAETAQLAIRAALTGHLVLSTLHTNDGLAAIPRLRDLGIESFLLAAALRLVAAQRLVRRLCPDCKESHPANARLQDEHRLPDAAFCRSVGCPACRGAGFRGRIAIHEVIPTAKFTPLIERDAPLAELVALREREGCVTLWQHGLAAAASGQTTIEQVARVL